MTKGKYAARSDIRRAEAAHHHIDRLIGELTEAKLRARVNQDAADRLPATLAELERVKALADAGSSDALERERAASREALEAAEDRMRRFIDLFVAVIARFREDPDKGFTMTVTEWGELRELAGSLDGLFSWFGNTRDGRRNCARSASELMALFRVVGQAERKREKVAGRLIAERYGIKGDRPEAPDEDD